MAKLGNVVTNLNAVVTTATGDAVEGSTGDGSSWVITGASVTTGGTVLIEGSLDGTTWATLSTTSVGATGSTAVSVTGRWAWLRARVSARTDGTFTVKCALWED